MKTMSTREAAFAYLESRLSIIPIRLDGSKQPNARVLPDGEWKPYQSERPTRREVMQWFGHGQHGIAIIGGAVSGNLERIDLDAPGVLQQWLELCEQEDVYKLAMSLPQVKTPRDGWGWHIYYRCTGTTIPGNLILARTVDGKTLIETRGEGGYTIAPGSPAATHASGREYELVNGDLCNIPDITPEQRETLLACAYALNEYRDKQREHRPPKPSPENADELRPGDAYNQSDDWRELLEQHGWRFVRYAGETEQWRRPGKDRGISATFNHGGSRLFWPFSSNCAPFEAGVSYSPFAVYTVLQHDGDFSAAASTLANIPSAYLSTEDGFIVPVDTRAVHTTDDEDHEPPNDSADSEPDTEAEPAPPVNLFEDNIFTLDQWFARPVNHDWIVDPLLRRGELAFLYGAPKSGKTFTAIDLILAAVTGRQWCGQRYTINDPMNVVLAIGEGHYGLSSRISAACEKFRVTHPEISARFTVIPMVPQLYPAAPNPSKSAKKFVEAVLGASIAPDLLIIDTYARAILGADENSNKDASLILDTLQVLQKKLSCAVMVIHHASKGMGELRGASAILGGADIVLKCSRDGNARKLEVEFAKDIPEQGAVGFSLTKAESADSVYVEWGEEATGARSLADRILKFLSEEAVSWFTAKDIAEALGEDAPQVTKRLWALKREGEVVQRLRHPDRRKSNWNPMEWRVLTVDALREDS